MLDVEWKQMNLDNFERKQMNLSPKGGEALEYLFSVSHIIPENV